MGVWVGYVGGRALFESEALSRQRGGEERGRVQPFSQPATFWPAIFILGTPDSIFIGLWVSVGRRGEGVW